MVGNITLNPEAGAEDAVLFVLSAACADRQVAAAHAHGARDDGPHRRHARTRTTVGGARHGVFTRKTGTLSTTSSSTCSTWARNGSHRGRSTRAVTADRQGQVDRYPRRFGLRLELPATGAGGGLRQRGREGEVVKDFVAAWTKVMNLDRFDSPDRSHERPRRLCRASEMVVKQTGCGGRRPAPPLNRGISRATGHERADVGTETIDNTC